MSEATKRPWLSAGDCGMSDGDDKTIAIFDSNIENYKANRDFALTATNMHDGLLALLKRAQLRGGHPETCLYERHPRGVCDCGWDEFSKDIESALAAEPTT